MNPNQQLRDTAENCSAGELARQSFPTTHACAKLRVVKKKKSAKGGFTWRLYDAHRFQKTQHLKYTGGVVKLVPTGSEDSFFLC